MIEKKYFSQLIIHSKYFIYSWSENNAQTIAANKNNPYAFVLFFLLFSIVLLVYQKMPCPSTKALLFPLIFWYTE